MTHLNLPTFFLKGDTNRVVLCYSFKLSLICDWPKWWFVLAIGPASQPPPQPPIKNLKIPSVCDGAKEIREWKNRN